MRHLVFRLLALGLLAAASCSHAADYECDQTKPETTPSSRFTINVADGTAHDSKTQLTWRLCAEGQNYDGNGHCTGKAREYKWDDAVAAFGGTGSGWRMPNFDELRSLIEKRCEKPATNLAVFPESDGYFFWSASAVAGRSEYAWGVNFSNGYDSNGDKARTLRIRLVRGGQFFDPFGTLVKQEKELAEAERKKQQELAEAERKKQQELAEAQRKEQQYQSTLNGPSPRAMYLLGAQMEDQDKEDKAKALYRKIMSAFPDSDFAIKAGDRLTQLRDVGNIADGAKRAAERVAESNRQDAERAGNEQRARQSRNCESSHSQCMAMCNGMSDSYGKWGGTPPRTTCKWDCDHARSACR